MDDYFVVLAQTLKENGSDLMRKNGCDVSAGREREKIHIEVSDLADTATSIFESVGIRLFANKGHFIMDLWSSEYDWLGRNATIVYYGNYNKNNIEHLKSEVIRNIGKFADDNRWSLPEEHEDRISKAFEILKKKSRRRGRWRIAGIVVLVLLIVLFVLCIRVV